MGIYSLLRFFPMLTECRADVVALWAPAKVNLFLEVLGKRNDGYHEIATLMTAVGLYDTLIFKEEPSGKIEFACDHPELTTGPENLVQRAARLLQAKSSCLRGASIRLVKRIPMAAGLAGGSTDAAATLVGLNRLWGLGWSNDELTRLAAEIGSDTAFFVRLSALGPRPWSAAWCTGRGEIVTEIKLGTPLDIVLACPNKGLATAEVYRSVQVPNQPMTGEEMLRATEEGITEEIGRRLHNRLQASAEMLCPELAVLRSALPEGGWHMSGSGTSLFRLCHDRQQAIGLVAEAHKASGSFPPSLGGVRLFVVRSAS